MVKSGPTPNAIEAPFHISVQAALTDLRQPLAAPLGRRSEPVPAALAPAAIGFLPTGRGDDRAILEGRADAIPDAIERCDDLAGHAAGLRQHRIDVVHREVAEKALFENREQPRPKSEREAHVGEGGLIGHRFSSA